MSSDHTKTLAFIEDYKSFTALWDVNHKDYTNKIKRNDAVNALAMNYKMSVREVKNKIKSLRSYFAKEHQKVTEKNSAAGEDDVYDSPWFAYKSLMFILDSITVREAKETGPGQTKNTEAENPGTFEDNNDDSQDGETVPLSQSMYISESERAFAHLPIRTKRNLKRSREDEREQEAYNFLTVATDHLTNIDEFSVFGLMVTLQLRKLNRRNQAIAKNYIQNYLFDMEMREMNSVPSDNLSPTLSHSVTPSTSYVPGPSKQSCQSVNSDYSNTSTNQLHDTVSADSNIAEGACRTKQIEMHNLKKAKGFKE